MSRKVFSCGILIFLAFWTSLYAADKPGIIEHLVVADTGRIPTYLSIVDPDVLQPFVTSPFLTFQVPASPKSDTLFFAFWGGMRFKWSGGVNQIADCTMWLECVSSVIPSDVAVSIGFLVCREYLVGGAGGYSPTPISRSQSGEFLMRRGQLDMWYVRSKTTGAELPQDQAIPIISALIENGFAAEVHAEGKVQGVSLAYVFPAHFHVTRIAK